MNAVHAQLIGTDKATALGLTVRGSSPVFALCRKLRAAGVDPTRPLHAYRGGVLALRVSSIQEGAALTVKSAGNGSPIFAPMRGATASPMRFPVKAVKSLTAGGTTA